MFGWFSRVGEVIKDWWDRLTGRGRDEEDEEDEDEEDEEDEDEEEEEEAEEAEDEDDEDAWDEEDESEGEDDQEEEDEEEADGEDDEDDDYDTLIDLVREIEDEIDQHAEYLTNEELARTDELLEQLYELLSEYDTLDADDRAALIDLALELLDALERIVMHAAERADNDDACPQRRGPFATYEEARRYASDIPLPTWVFQDGLGWWWVCIEESTPASLVES